MDQKGLLNIERDRQKKEGEKEERKKIREKNEEKQREWAIIIRNMLLFFISLVPAGQDGMDT